MTKIIKVTGCHDCPYSTYAGSLQGVIEYICTQVKDFEVTAYYNNKDVPINCPLDDEVHADLRDFYEWW